MGNKPSSTTSSFANVKPTNFLVLDKNQNVGFLKTVSRKTQYPSATQDEVNQMKGVNITQDSQLFEVQVGLNWVVVGPLVALVLMFLGVIFYYGSSGRRTDSQV